MLLRAACSFWRIWKTSDLVLRPFPLSWFQGFSSYLFTLIWNTYTFRKTCPWQLTKKSHFCLESSLYCPVCINGWKLLAFHSEVPLWHGLSLGVYGYREASTDVIDWITASNFPEPSLLCLLFYALCHTRRLIGQMSVSPFCGWGTGARRSEAAYVEDYALNIALPTPSAPLSGRGVLYLWPAQESLWSK